MDEHDDVATEILGPLRAICLRLPEAHEERAWTGTRWRIRTRTFAHALRIESGWPPAYARAAASNGPIDVLMFRSADLELDVLRRAGPPFFAPVWRADEVGMVVGVGVDWDDVAALVTESYCVVAPKKLAQAAARLTGEAAT